MKLLKIISSIARLYFLITVFLSIAGLLMGGILIILAMTKFDVIPFEIVTIVLAIAAYFISIKK